MIRRGIGVQSYVSVGGGTDADAQAFITAAGIADATQQSAINTLVTDLKTYGVWTKMKAIYPFVGGTSSTHKWNLKDPRDLDAAFRLVFNGGWTHSSTGALPNGTNGYADTFLTPSIVLSTNSNGMGFYTSRANNETNIDVVNMGSYAGTTQVALITYNAANLINARLNGSITSVVESGLKGFFHAYRQSSTVTVIFNNSTKKATANSGGTLPNWKVFLGNTTLNANTPYTDGYTRNDFRFAFIGDGLTDTEAANLYTAVQAYQTSLNRQV